MLEALAALEHRGLQPVEPLRGRFFGVGIEPEGPNPGFAELRVRKVLGWPQRCKLAHAFLRGYSYKRLKLVQLLGQRSVFLTWAPEGPSSRRASGESTSGGGIMCSGNAVIDSMIVPVVQIQRFGAAASGLWATVCLSHAGRLLTSVGIPTDSC
jgi:hypothetical protein